MITFDNNAATDAAIKQQMMTSTISRTLSVTIGGTSIPAENVVSDSLSIKNVIMDDDSITFGGCVPTEMRLNFFNLRHVVTISGIASALISVVLTVVYIDSNSTQQTITQPLFTGYVYSVRTLQKRAYTEIIAYDELYRMSQTKCKEAILMDFVNYPTGVSTLNQFMRRALQFYDGNCNTSFEAQYLARGTGFQYAISPNYPLGMTRTLFEDHADENLTVLDVVKAHSELNAQFAYIDGEGNLQYTKLFREGGGVVSKKNVAENVQYYQDFKCEDFSSAQIKCLSFPYNGDQTFLYGGTSDKRFWYISDNFITKCIQSQSTVSFFVTNFYNTSTGKDYVFNAMSAYIPFSATTFGEFWIEVGDRLTADISLYNNATGQYDTEQIDSFVFQRDIKGIANLKVSVEAKGSEYLSKDEVTAT